MGFYAERLSRIKLSPSTAATMRARELRAQGRDIIALTIGQPDFNTPEHVKQGVMAALARNETKYPDRKSTRLNSSHIPLSRMPSSA